MITFEEAREILDAAIEALPEGIFRGLNGGVILSPDAPLHPNSVDDQLRVMGNYQYQPHGMGRFVTIYYGSFEQLYANAGRPFWEKKLTEVLYHELTHHLEHLAGDISLELEDRASMRRYLDRNTSPPRE